jgi:iron(III) transport system substrate-binding protein
MNARAAAVAAVVVLGAALSACGSSAGSANGQPTITLYNGQHPQTTQALVAAFERQTGIHVRERDGDESELAQQILQEGKSSPADVMYAENSPALMSLEEQGLLTSLPADLLSQVPSQYSSPSGKWVGVSARVSVIVYNTSRVSQDQLPTSVLDLAQPQWKGKLALAPTETDFAPIVTAVAHSEGQKAALAWLKGMKSNGASHTYPDNESLVAAVNDGQAAIGVLDHYYWWRLQAELGSSSMHSKIAYFAPKDPGYVVDVSGAGVLSSSKHQAAAEELLAFLVSNAGQQVIVASDSFEYPLHPGVAPRAGLTPFDQLQPYPISIADLGDGSSALNLLQQAQLL